MEWIILILIILCFFKLESNQKTIVDNQKSIGDAIAKIIRKQNVKE